MTTFVSATGLSQVYSLDYTSHFVSSRLAGARSRLNTPTEAITFLPENGLRIGAPTTLETVHRLYSVGCWWILHPSKTSNRDLLAAAIRVWCAWSSVPYEALCRAQPAQVQIRV